MRPSLILIAALFGLVGHGTAAQAAGDPARGAELGVTCLGCHGIEGYRNAYPSYRVPRLGGQNADYLVAALQGYRAGTRPHPTMRANATALTDDEIEHIAAWFAGFGPPQTGDPGGSVKAPEKAALCVACHGEAGIAPAPMWPNLAGQHRDYLETTITSYRDKQRQDPVMQVQVASLTDEEIRELAGYFSGLPGLFTPAR